MKIIFEKGIKVEQMMECLEKFILEKAEDYPILKNDMTVNITLKNNINQINPDNERVFNISKKDIDEMVEELKKEELEHADWIFEEQWKIFIRDYSASIIREIKTDENYLAIAEEKGRSKQNIEKRKKSLEKKRKQLEHEYKRIELIASYVEMYIKGQVDFEYKKEVYFNIYTEEYTTELVKIMKFDNGDIFIPDINDTYQSCIKNKDGQVIVGNEYNYI